MAHIEVGDYVKHLRAEANEGPGMSVVVVDTIKAKCAYFDEDGTHKEEWFSLSDLVLFRKA